jgi:hypothetical protein
MREVCLCLLVTCGAATGHAQGRHASAAAALADARNALGGAALDVIRTIGVRGRGTRDLGALGLTSEIELRIGLPDRYVRIERLFMGGASAELTTGFAGTVSFQRASGPTGERLDPAALLPDDVRAVAARAATQALRQELGLILLGFFAASFDGYPMETAPAGVAESPEGAADVVALTRSDGFDARLFIDRRTRLPLMVSWQGPDAAAAAQRLAANPRGRQAITPEALLAEVEPVEHRLYFLEYRPVAAVRWPHRLRRSIGGRTVEEWTVDAFALNPAFPAGTFEPQP